MALAERTAHVNWAGNLAQGSGTIDETTSGALGSLPVTWASRTEAPNGKTSPEELIAAAHAACYAMAFSATLGRHGHTPEELQVSSTCVLDRVEGGVKITTMRLSVRGKVPGLSAEEFANLAAEGEKGCPVSNVLRGGAEIELSAELM